MEEIMRIHRNPFFICLNLPDFGIASRIAFSTGGNTR